jgi:hypothetical protein
MDSEKDVRRLIGNTEDRAESAQLAAWYEEGERLARWLKGPHPVALVAALEALVPIAADLFGDVAAEAADCRRALALEGQPSAVLSLVGLLDMAARRLEEADHLPRPTPPRRNVAETGGSDEELLKWLRKVRGETEAKEE